MVCIAAFIILIIVGIFIAILSIWNRELGKKYLKVLKKSWHCFSRRVTLRKCDTNFSDDVKNLFLKKVVVKKPKLVKPISAAVEIGSILIVVITAWSLVEAAKAGLALWVFGTCNVSQPSNCALGADSCSLDEEGLNWFEEWDEIITNIPDRFKKWDTSGLATELKPAYTIGDSENVAISLIDPGCSVCMQSYKNIQQDEKFLQNHQIIIVPYLVQNTDSSARFKNSEIIIRYMLAASSDNSAETSAEKILTKIFTEENEKGINYQSVFNNELDAESAEKLLQSWLKEWGIDKAAIKSLAEYAKSNEVTEIMKQNKQIVDEKIHPKGIPTFIYDGKKHLGLYKI